jgi:[ribosomal protein S5]-alanine N-acetyltransferase
MPHPANPQSQIPRRLIGDRRDPTAGRSARRGGELMLSTDRLRLRPFDRERDWADVLAGVLLDSNVNGTWMAAMGVGVGHPEAERLAAEEFLPWFAEGRARGLIVWVMRTPDGALVGISGLMVADPPFDGSDPEFGCLVAARWHGLGLATEAGRAVLDDAWRRLDIERVITVLEHPTPSSRRLVDKLGFRFVEVAFDSSARPLVVLAAERPTSAGAADR